MDPYSNPKMTPYWNDPKRKVTALTKFGPSSAKGIFLGYHIQPGVFGSATAS